MDGHLWDPISLKDAPGAGDERFHRGSGGLGPGTRTSKSVVDKYRLEEEKMDNMTIRTRTGLHKFPFGKKFKILGYTFNQAGRMQDSLDGRMQSANKDLVERSEDLQKRRRTVKCKMRKNGGVSPQCDLLRERKQVLEYSGPGQNEWMGDKACETIVQIQRKEMQR